MNGSPYRTLVVDDEPRARQGLIRLLDNVPAFTCVGEAPNGLEAIGRIQQLQPDLLLLDIQMPEINGFEVLQSLPPQGRPMTIFITAYDSYAIQAFEVHAIDYILKPFTDARFFAALERARQQLEAQSVSSQQAGLGQLLAQWAKLQEQTPDKLVKPSDPLDHRLIIKHEGAIHFLEYAEIRWVEAYDYYVKIHVADRFFLVRKSLKSLAEDLPSAHFIRVHKSALVNLQYIQRMEPIHQGAYTMFLSEGQRIKVSKTYSKAILDLLSK